MGSTGKVLITRFSTPAASWSEHAQGHGLLQKMDLGLGGQGRCVRDAKNEVSMARNWLYKPAKDNEISLAFALIDQTLVNHNGR
jgi:hypothetical protein